MEMDGLTRDGTAEPVSRDQISRRERGQGNIIFPCSADHEQDWQPNPVDPYSCYACHHTYTCNQTKRPALRFIDQEYFAILKLQFTGQNKTLQGPREYTCRLCKIPISTSNRTILSSLILPLSEPPVKKQTSLLLCLLDITRPHHRTILSRHFAESKQPPLCFP